MKKLSGLAAFAAILCLSGAALAADLSNAIGSTCDGEGTWHFVNNQTRGAAAGTLTADFGLADKQALLQQVEDGVVDGPAARLGHAPNALGQDRVHVLQHDVGHCPIPIPHGLTVAQTLNPAPIR